MIRRQSSISSICMAICMMWLSGTAMAAQSGVLIKTETMYAQPASSSARLGSVTKGTAVSVITKKQGWMQINNGKTQGWVRMLSVRTSGAVSSNAAADIAGMAQMATGKRQPGKIVATAGIRGLNEEDLKQAHFSEQGLKDLASYKLGASAAQSFAKQGKLVRQSVKYLPDPEAAQ